MSTDLSIIQDRGADLATLMGVAPATSGSSDRPSVMINRLSQVHQPIMGEVEFNGKSIKTEVVPVGAFKLKNGEDFVYSTTATIRVFAMRQQWQRWNGETNEMEKSVMANSLSGDLQDSIGGFNLGRPSGYIEDFNALPEATKQLMRTVKRVKIYMGMMTLDAPMNEKGEPVPGDDFTNIPFIMDVKNRDSLKAIDDVLARLKKANKLPIMSDINLVGVEDSIPTGAKFGKIDASQGAAVEMSDADQTQLGQYLDFIEMQNARILDLYHERNDKSLSPEDAKVVNSVIDSNDFTEVEG